jgi:hypothetical protein
MIMRKALAVVLASLMSVASVVACSASDSSQFGGTNPNPDAAIPESGGFGGDSGDSGVTPPGPPQCTPGQATGFSPTWTPPSKSAACSTADIAAYYDACLADTAQRPDCDMYTADATHKACVGCIEAAGGAGPIEWHDTGGITHHDFIVNFPGCVALELGVAADGCGAAWHAQLDCERASCDMCFASNGGPNDIRLCLCSAEGGTLDPNGACHVSTMATAPCTSYLKTRVQKCAGAMDAGAPSLQCFPMSGEAGPDYVKRLIAVTCGM